MNAEEILKEINVQAKRLALYEIPLNGAKAAVMLDENKFIFARAQDDNPANARFVMEIIKKEQFRKECPGAARVLEKRKKGCVWVQVFPKYCKIAGAVGKKIPPVLDDMAQIIGVTIKLSGADDAAKAARILRRNGACLSGESVVAAGKDAAQAFAAVLIAEKAALAFNLANHIGGAKPVSRLDARFMRIFYKTKYSKKRDGILRNTKESFKREIPKEEMALRQQICDLGKQMLSENLVQGTWGNISMRLDEGSMLCTPSGLDYFTITPYDIVKVFLEDYEYEGDIKPTSEKIFHGEILKERPDITCIIHTHPYFASVYAAAHCPLEMEDGSEIPLAAYGLPGSEGLSKNVVNAFKEADGCIMANHGIAVGAKSAAEALALCRRVEETARKSLM